MLKGKKIGVLVVAYNALSHLVKVLDRIPEQSWHEVDEIAVFDDASQDATYELAQGYKLVNKLDKLKIYRNEKNLGYGGNQKRGFRYFAERGFDVVILLHGDGQYAPEILADLYRPIVEGRAEVVLGSRMMNKYGGPLNGGMPLYKYVGNRILSYWENRSLNMNLTEFHSGYRAYSIEALRYISLENCTDDFHFDTQIIVKLNHFNFRFLEVPIPTYYGDEICHVDGLRYARDVYRTVKEYKETVEGYRTSPAYRELRTIYPIKPYEYSSHTMVSQMIKGVGQSILDVGCNPPAVEEMSDTGRNGFVGVAPQPLPPDKATYFREFMIQDLEEGLPIERLIDRQFDYILLLDILEHLVNHTGVLQDAHTIAGPETKVIISVPNVANIYVRLNLLLGRFEYAERGILDRTHLRFFTRRTLRRWVQANGFVIEQQRYTNIPLNELFRNRESNLLLKILNHMLYFFTNLFSGLLAYQIIVVARKK